MQEGSFADIDKLASRLNQEIDCAIRFPPFDKNVLVCSHNIAFSVSRLRDSDDWSWAKKKHRKEAK